MQSLSFVHPVCSAIAVHNGWREAIPKNSDPLQSMQRGVYVITSTLDSTPPTNCRASKHKFSERSSIYRSEP